MHNYKLINNLKIDEILYEDVYNFYGQLIASKDSKLTAKHIDLFIKNKITGVFVLDEDIEEINIPPVVRRNIRNELVSKLSFNNFELINKDLFNDLIEMGIIYYVKYKK